jgi:acetoin utilization deacetylase AcuC-like enzyme
MRMANTGLVLDNCFERHAVPTDHPERPERLATLAKVFQESGLVDKCARIAPTPANKETILLNHDEEYLQRVKEACASDAPFIDAPDSKICRESFDVSLLAAGAAVSAVDEVMAGRLDNAFCAVRPPGHHAERGLSMGFCLLNNVAIAAQHLLKNHDLDRILILDWDVHHGNGTQHSFEDDPRVLFVSLHGHPGIVYPGTGFANERGRGEGEGFTINVPIVPPGRDEVWRRAFDETILPSVDQFGPQFVLISAGFDAHKDDPLAPLELETESYGWMTDELLDVAKRHCDGRLVSLLEGGYNLEALSQSAALHASRLLDA